MKQQGCHQQWSDVIGLIYDAAIEPVRWPSALEGMCGLVDAFFGSISVIDQRVASVRFLSKWGGDPYWVDLLDRKYASMMPFIPILHRFDIGESFNIATATDFLGELDLGQRPFVTEWAMPAGVGDSASVVLQRNSHRVAAISLSTSLQRGPVTREELAILNLLAPHVSRALMISDLIDRKSLAADTFERMLDTLEIGVIAVDAYARVRHANQAAGIAIGGDGPLEIRGGRLVVSRSAEDTVRLQTTISSAEDNLTSMAGSGIGIPLRFADGRPAVGHVLPLRQSSARQISGAVAVIFVATPVDAQQAPLEALIGLYGLTDAEGRVLNQISEGKNRNQAAASLAIADSTAKTHLDRIFSKTGTSTQSELARLISSLTVPAHGSP